MLFLARLAPPWALLASLVAGCGLTLDYDPPTDTGAPIDTAGIDAPGTDAPDAPRPTCLTADDCSGPLPPCAGGAWACFDGECGVSCPGCDVDVDHDGYGEGAGCAGLDCRDDDPAIADLAREACYPPGAVGEGIGACVAGVRECVAGVFGDCSGAIVPVVESCNGIDDDCDGATDDGFPTVTCGLGRCATTGPLCVGGLATGCMPPPPSTLVDGCGAAEAGMDDDCDGRIDEDCGGCVWVDPSADGDPADPTNRDTPFVTVDQAIDWAHTDPAMRPQRICLLAARCSADTLFHGDVVLEEGITILGNFSRESGGRCAGRPVTVIEASSSDGVLIDERVTSYAGVFDVAVRAPASGARRTAITIRRAQGVVLSGVHVLPALSSSTTAAYGVVVEEGARVTVSRSAIAATPSALSVGLRVEASHVEVVDSCAGPLDATGRCATACSDRTTGEGVLGIRGSMTAATNRAIELDGAGDSVIGQVTVCASGGNRVSGIYVTGDSTGLLIAGNSIDASGRSETRGIDLEACGGTAPWIIGNGRIGALGGVGNGAGVHSLGDCAPVIERNRILGGEGNAYGVVCAGGSPCSIVANPEITGASLPANTATGVICADGSCALVEANIIRSGTSPNGVGLSLERTSARVARNFIDGGCAEQTVALRAVESSSRVENNLVRIAGECPATSPMTPVLVALEVDGGVSGAMLDVHSNDLVIDVGGALLCSSRAVVLSGSPSALLRGNVLDSGACADTITLLEATPTADPLALHSNYFVTSPVLYFDEGMASLSRLAEVNGLLDTRAIANLSGRSPFLGPADFRIGASSPCADADGSAAPPRIDIVTTPRDATPDIGAYEHMR